MDIQLSYQDVQDLSEALELLQEYVSPRTAQQHKDRLAALHARLQPFRVRPVAAKARPSAGFCYINHKTGDSDHMYAHIETESCTNKARRHWTEAKRHSSKG